MIDISFKIDGKKVNPKNIRNALEASALSNISNSIKKSIGNLKCLEHNKYPKIIVNGRSLNDLSFEVSGCCDKFMEKIQKKMQE